MHLFIPDIGIRLKLTKAWTFSLYLESRNLSFADDAYLETLRQLNKEYHVTEKAMWAQAKVSEGGVGRSTGPGQPGYAEHERARRNLSAHTRGKPNESIQRTLPAGTILEIDRIYIRQGNAEYSSVTFKARGIKVLRFWAKLDDVNRIQCTVLDDKTERAAHSAGGGANCFHG